MTPRRTYRREPEEKRREALIAAALELVAEGGPKAATVRAIAERAGVTAGLIRHYFVSKDDLSQAAYRALMDRMTDDTGHMLDGVPPDPVMRLAVFVSATLRPPVVDGKAVGLWAGFIHQVRSDPALLAVHETSYLRFRDALQALIADLPRAADAGQLRREAIACNAVIDGLWLEGSVLPDTFGPGEIERIGLISVGALLGVNLVAALAGLPPGLGDT
ncbi:MAG: TetR family transcriptional regulator C-terminal domain-containing protein [Pseudomonadota bacterium]